MFMQAFGLVRFVMLAVGAAITVASTIAVFVVLLLTRSRARLQDDGAASRVLR